VLALSHPKTTGATAGKTTKPPGSTTGAANSTPASANQSVPASSSAPARSAPASSSGASVATAKAPLVVLNNTTTTHLAEQAATRFEAGGWTVTKFDNYQNDILSTCAYYDPDTAGSKAAAEALRKQFPTIKRVEPQFSELSSWDSPIVVILTPDYQA